MENSDRGLKGLGSCNRPRGTRRVLWGYGGPGADSGKIKAYAGSFKDIACAAFSEGGDVEMQMVPVGVCVHCGFTGLNQVRPKRAYRDGLGVFVSLPMSEITEKLLQCQGRAPTGQQEPRIIIQYC